MVNNIQLTWLLRTYKTCNSMVRFSKYEFYNKLLGGVTLLRVTPCITWTQSIYIYIYIYVRALKCSLSKSHYYINLEIIYIPKNKSISRA